MRRRSGVDSQNNPTRYEVNARQKVEEARLPVAFPFQQILAAVGILRPIRAPVGSSFLRTLCSRYLPQQPIRLSGESHVVAASTHACNLQKTRPGVRVARTFSHHFYLRKEIILYSPGPFLTRATSTRNTPQILISLRLPTLRQSLVKQSVCVYSISLARRTNLFAS